MERYAPVIIPTLCRYDKLKVLVDSLANNKEYAKYTELVIGLDYPPAEKYVEGYKKIKAYLPTITGFGKVKIVEQTENKGTVGNEKTLIDYIYSEGYDRFIFTEDDNEFSANFLEYMNKGLDKYENNSNVYSISGYNYPINMEGYEKNIYCSYRFSAWGCAFWKKKRLTLTTKDAVRFVLMPPHFLKLLFKTPVKLLYFAIMLIKGEVFGDSCYELYCVINSWVSIFPTVSKVRNWGHDGSGLHGEIKPEEDPCYNQTIDLNTSFEYDDVPLKNMRIQSLEDYFYKSPGWFIKKFFKRVTR